MINIEIEVLLLSAPDTVDLLALLGGREAVGQYTGGVNSGSGVKEVDKLLVMVTVVVVVFGMMDHIVTGSPGVSVEQVLTFWNRE